MTAVNFGKDEFCMRLCCPCHFGLESVLNREIKMIGGENPEVTDGRITFDGSYETLARANICLRTAERVLCELARFTVYSFNDLFEGVKAINFEDYIGIKDAFPVKGHSLKSKLHSVPDCQSIIKKAVVERLKSVYHVGRFEETGAKKQITFNILKDVCTVYLDTTGEGLHKRGYRTESNLAPIKETLAAGIVDLAHINYNGIVCDPMCGSGTLIIESALKALNIAPGIKRSFAAESWAEIPGEIWKNERIRASENLRECSFSAYGSDIDPSAIRITEKNCLRAGVDDRCKVKALDIKNFRLQKGWITICNPPYGERLLDIKHAEELYKVMGQVLSPSKDNPCYIISPHEEFEKFFGKKADKKRKLYNGMLKCNLYMYYL